MAFSLCLPRRVLLACAALLVVIPSVRAGSTETDYGEDNCGDWKSIGGMAVGETQECCSNVAKGEVMGYEYTVDGEYSKSNVEYSIYWEDEITSGYSENQCRVYGLGKSCTGVACRSSMMNKSGYKNSCNAREDYSDSPKKKVCLTMKCTSNCGGGMRRHIEFEIASSGDGGGDGNAFLAVLAAADMCPDKCAGETGKYTGKCGGLAVKDTSKWCDKTNPPVCCTNGSEDDCCKPNDGAIAGIIVALVVVIIAIILGSCACCKCCPLYNKCCCAPKQPLPGMAAPGVAMQAYPSAAPVTTYGQPVPQTAQPVMVAQPMQQMQPGQSMQPQTGGHVQYYPSA